MNCKAQIRVQKSELRGRILACRNDTTRMSVIRCILKSTTVVIIVYNILFVTVEMSGDMQYYRNAKNLSMVKKVIDRYRIAKL